MVKRNKLVFSLVREQSIFMTVVLSILTFLSVLAFGIALSIGSGVIRWNNQWNRYATVQISNTENTAFVKKVFEKNASKIASVKEITKSEMESMMKPWISSGAKLNTYLPQMFEIELKKTEYVKSIRDEIAPRAKFLTHTSALKTTMSAGWKLVAITGFVFVIMIISIGLCVSYISRNIATLHKHELEILNQVGASDKFISNQMQIIIGKISSVACLVGFTSAVPVLLMILGTAHSARVGLLATLSLTSGNWLTLMILPLLIIVFSVYITKKTTIKILSGK